MDEFGSDRWMGHLRGRRLRPLGVHGRGLGRPLRLVALGDPAQGRGRPERPRRASSPRGRCSTASSRSRSRRRWPTSARTGTRSPRCRRRSSWPSTASAPASARGTSCSRAPGAASRASRRSLPELAELGFDVVYLPPIHPIGETNRKGKNNMLKARQGDPGQPLGDRLGRGRPRRAIHPDLGTIEDFDRLVAARPTSTASRSASTSRSSARPDHPWLKEHPEWFNRRPDGTLKYAENPPKKLPGHLQRQLRQRGLAGLWEALRDVVAYWVDHGVKVFRVDNPHTKPVPFWEWLIAEIHAPRPATSSSSPRPSRGRC